MRYLLLLSVLVALSGCRAHQTYFRGVDRSIYVVEIEELEPEAIATQAADFVADQKARVRTDWLTPTALTTDGLQGRPEWTPDGSRIVFQSVRSGGMVANPWEQTFLMDADGSNQRRITPGVGKTHGAVVVPSEQGFLIAYGSTHHLGTTPARDTPAVGDSADHEMELVLQDLSRGTFTTLAQGPGFDGEPHYCDDGSAFAFTSAREGDLEVYVQVGDEGPLRATRRTGPDESPRLSPDCSQLLWVRRGTNGSELVVATTQGSEPRTLLSAQAALHTPSYSPDGALIVFSADLANPGGQLDLYVVTVDGGDLRRLTFSPGSERSPRIAPDGASILYTDDAGGSPQLVVSPWDPTFGAPWTAERRDAPAP